MTHTLFLLSCILSGASFVMFVGVALERLFALRAAEKRLQQSGTALAATRAMAPGAMPQAAEALELDRVFDALARLTDSLSKAPLPVVALIASLLFLLVALACAALGVRQGAPNASLPPAAPSVIAELAPHTSPLRLGPALSRQTSA